MPASSEAPRPARAIRDLPDPSDVPNPVRFALVDVFGEGPLTGNPLAVLDLTRGGSNDPPESWMAAVAREMNQAETTFIFAPTPTAQARLRSFTAGGTEVFGAGHNALGAWCWLLDTGRISRPGPGDNLVQRIGDRDLQVLVHDDQLVMLQDTMLLGGEVDPDTVRAAIGLTTEHLDPAVPPRVVGTGVNHLMVGVTGQEALGSCQPDRQALLALTASVGAQGLYVAAIGPDRPVHSAHTRFFNPGAGLDEDPATGSAAGPLAAYLDHLGLLTKRHLRVQQGRSMGRPSTLTARITREGTTTIGGAAVVSAQGWIQGPPTVSSGPAPSRVT